MSNENQLTLPYEEITQLASRDFIRSAFKISTKVSYKIPLSDILIREGFNKRMEYEGINELADSIAIHGLIEPLTLDVLPDGRAFIEKGHRRHKAFLLLVEQGKIQATELIEFFPNKSNITEEIRMANQYTSNNHQMPLKPLEQAAVAFSLKHDFGSQKSHEEIASLMGVSRQKVDNLILFAEQPDDVKQYIKNEGLKFTDGVAYIRSLKN